MVVTIAYTGLRWGETIGLEHDSVHDNEIHVEWQLREIRSTFHRLPPKDDSYRSPNWEPCLPVDLPPFLADLLARQIKAQSQQRCACAGQHGGSGQYVFLGPDGGHPRRSNYAREDSLRERAALDEHSPVPLLDDLLAPLRAQEPEQGGHKPDCSRLSKRPAG
jgi:hypothetical protein